MKLLFALIGGLALSFTSCQPSLQITSATSQEKVPGAKKNLRSTVYNVLLQKKGKGDLSISKVCVFESGTFVSGRYDVFKDNFTRTVQDLNDTNTYQLRYIHKPALKVQQDSCSGTTNGIVIQYSTSKKQNQTIVFKEVKKLEPTKGRAPRPRLK